MVDLNALAEAVASTLSPDPARRRQAEALLSSNAAAPGFSMLLLQLTASDSAPVHVRQAAAVYMKNHTASQYAPDDWEDTVPAADRDNVKPAILNIVLSVPVSIRRPLGNALATIADKEYPTKWPQLVPSLSEKLGQLLAPVRSDHQSPELISKINWDALQAILETLQAIFERYPDRMRTNALYTEINYSLEHTSKDIQTLLAIFGKIVEQDIASKDPKLIDACLTCAALVCKLFFCLSWQDLPAYYEDHLTEYMGELRKLLKLVSPVIDDMSPDEPGRLDDVQAAVMDIANIYATKYDEEFRPFLPHFISDAWALLMRRGTASKFDLVVTTGIKFLSSVSRSPDSHLFKEDSVLKEVCNRIVVPNIELREEDMELFEDDPLQYVRRDLEGSDTGTRRRGAVELVKGLCVNYEKQVTDIFSSYVQSMLAPQVDWQKRDSAIYLVIALGWKSGTATQGATQTSSLINIGDFSNNFILPELRLSAKNPGQLSSPIFTADLIKFVISFRNQISKEGCAEVILLCGHLLGAQEAVVRTYAAACIERILTVKDALPESAQNGTPTPRRKLPYRFSNADIAPILPSLLPAVIAALKSNNRPDEYLMRLVLRLVTTSRDGMVQFVDSLLATLVEIFVAASANPANPLFNHYLFETIAALTHFNASPANIGTFESALLDPLCNVLVSDITEFAPYVFQVMAQLMKVHTDALPPKYASLMGPILTPTMWERRGYIPGMVQYIEMYVLKSGGAVVEAQQLEPILGVFQKLIASKATDHHGLHLVTTLFEAYDLAVLSAYVSGIFSALMVRLSKAKTAKFVKNLLCALSAFAIRFGVDALTHAFDSVDASVMAALFAQVWLPEVVSIRNAGERRLCSVALTHIACDDALVAKPPFSQQWARMVATNVALVEGIVTDDAQDGDDDEEDDFGAVHTGSAETYSTAHSQLKWGAPDAGAVPPLVANVDAQALLREKLNALLARHEQLKAMLGKDIDENGRAAIAKYVAAK